jgi:hypothetical protein
MLACSTLDLQTLSIAVVGKLSCTRKRNVLK